MEQKKNNKKIFIIIAVVVVLALIVAFVILNIKNNNDNTGISILGGSQDELMSKTEHTYGNSQTNITNEGVIAGDNEYLYYAGQTGLKYVIKKQNLQTGEVTDLITSNNSINYINLYNDEVYYLIESEKSIYKINKNGEDRKKVLENTIDFTIVDDYIFYIQKSGSWNKELYRVKIGETESQKISSVAVNEFSVFGNTIAFVDDDNHNLYVVDLDGKNEKKICDDKVDNITRYDNYVFLNSDTTGTFCRINIDGTGLKDVMNDSQDKYLIQDNQIIIPNYSFVFYDLDGNELRKFRSEESATMYNNTIYVELGIANNIIYYNEISFNSTGIELIQITD